MSAGSTGEEPRRRWDLPYVVGLVAGAALMAYGVVGLLDNTTSTRARQIATWVVGADLAHDVILAPIAALVGFAGARLLPRRAWPAVRAGLLATACAVAVAYPMLRGFTRDQVPHNPSAAPLDYGSAVLTVLVVVWAVVAGALIGQHITRIRRRRRQRQKREPAVPTVVAGPYDSRNPSQPGRNACTPVDTITWWDADRGR